VKLTATQHGRWRNRPVAYTEGMALSDTLAAIGGRVFMLQSSGNGAPVFDWSDPRVFATDRTLPDFGGGDGTKKPGKVRGIGSTAKEGMRYPLLEPGAPPGLRVPGIDGDGWWASRNWRKKLAAWNADSTLKWAVGRRAPARAKPGVM